MRPSRPVAQKAQASAQPTCDERQSDVVGVEERDAHRLDARAVAAARRGTCGSRRRRPRGGATRSRSSERRGRGPVEDLAPDVAGVAQRLAAGHRRAEQPARVGEVDAEQPGEAARVLVGDVLHGPFLCGGPRAAFARRAARRRITRSRASSRSE